MIVICRCTTEMVVSTTRNLHKESSRAMQLTIVKLAAGQTQRAKS